MFFKGKANATPVSDPGTTVTTIPEVFYGGANPEMLNTVATVKSPTATATSTAVNPVKTRLIAVGMIGVFTAVCAGAGWYYWNYLRTPAPITTSVVPQTTSDVTIPAVVPTSTETIIEPTTSLATVTSTEILATSTFNTVATVGDSLDFPTLNQIDATDFDADGLTDAEEEVLTTDPAIFDTDKDDYSDGQEVSNLYNPKAIAPVRLVESGLVKEYVSPNEDFRLYYPLPWTVGAVDSVGKNILLTAANGDYVEVKQIAKNSGEDFAAWFSRVAATEKITDLNSTVNRFNFSYLTRKDDLVAYYDAPQFVLVLVYHPTTDAPINFRHVMRMIVTSVRVKGLTPVAPI